MTTSPDSPDSVHDQLDALDDLIADVRALVSWEALCGASVRPAEPRLGADARAELTAPGPSAPRPSAPSSRRPTASPRAPSRPTPSPPGGGTQQPSLGNWGRFIGGGGSTSSPDAAVGKLGAAPNLAAIRGVLGDCERCGLCRGRRHIVFGVGSEDARLMVVGEAPGMNEDRVGEPFVGKAGQMLDRMLQNVLGVSRQQAYIANVVKCRPPDNRNPQAEEIARCRPFLMAQLRVIQPEVVLVLGNVASRALFDSKLGITRMRGRWRTLEYPGGRAQAMPTFHPAYLLRNPADKRLTFDDLKQVKAALST